MRERGIFSSPPLEQSLSDIIQLPPIKLRDYKPLKRRRGDEETQVAHTGDSHAGKITPSYNREVYRIRMETLFYSILTITNLHRNMYPIKKLHIIDTGDRIQGESPHQGSVIGETEMGARDQVIKLALPAWLEFIGSLKQNFTEVIVNFFPGNHGHEKLAPQTSNWDIALADLVKAKFERQKGITINVHEHFAGIVNIQGFKFLCAHWDGIPCQQGIPFFALDRRLKAWFIQYGGFHYALGGHYHKNFSNILAAGIEYSGVSTLVTDDEWALKRLGLSSNPSQSTFGVHERQGITWKYTLQVDDKFLPESEGKPRVKVEV